VSYGKEILSWKASVNDAYDPVSHPNASFISLVCDIDC